MSQPRVPTPSLCRIWRRLLVWVVFGILGSVLFPAKGAEVSAAPVPAGFLQSWQTEHIRRIYEKLHVRSRAQAVARYALRPMGDERPPRGSSRH